MQGEQRQRPEEQPGTSGVSRAESTVKALAISRSTSVRPREGSLTTRRTRAKKAACVPSVRDELKAKRRRALAQQIGRRA